MEDFRHHRCPRYHVTRLGFGVDSIKVLHDMSAQSETVHDQVSFVRGQHRHLRDQLLQDILPGCNVFRPWIVVHSKEDIDQS